MPSKMGRITKKIEDEPAVFVPKLVDGKAMIDVTTEDIRLGVPGHAFYCPLSRAVVRCVPGAYNCATTRDCIRIFFGTKIGYKTYPINEVISEYLSGFDVRGFMKPFSWELKL